MRFSQQAVDLLSIVIHTLFEFLSRCGDRFEECGCVFGGGVFLAERFEFIEHLQAFLDRLFNCGAAAADGDVDRACVREAQPRWLLTLAVGVQFDLGVAEQVVAGRAAGGDPCAVWDVEASGT